MLTGLRSSVDSPRGPRAEALLGLLGLLGVSGRDGDIEPRSLTVAHAEESAIDVIADLLHWLRAHGCDPDSALDRMPTDVVAEPAEAV
ncbi:hypothetical protein ACFV6M_22430 [Streptomyces californicus]|uniref:hypothetical protein n=1 Tax=Streptomyces californicus TaxID=67351 RepID=UPI003657FDD8